MIRFDGDGDLWVAVSGSPPPEIILRGGVSAIFRAKKGIFDEAEINLTQYIRLIGSEPKA